MKTCPATLAYRDMSDIGPARICGCPAVTPAGFCRRHDPATKPRRDARGRILAGRIAVSVQPTVTPFSKALPALQMDRGSIVGPMGQFYGRLADCNVLFAHELVHRANAYPKIIEALRELMIRCDGAEGVRADGSNIQTVRASALLRELGEGA